MIKIAAAEDNDFYQTKLYPIQDIVLADENIKYFYLTGGTALSRFYYQHRYSKDLDFFCDGLKYSTNDFAVFCQRLIYSLENKFDKIDFTINSEHYKRFFIIHNNIELKIECIYEAYKNVGTKSLIKTFYLDSKENICTNKLSAISDRKTIKDYVDLYYLLNDISFESIINFTKYKMVPLDYESAVIAFKNTIEMMEGDVIILKNINENDFKSFIKNLIQKMIDYAKTR